MTVVVLVAQEVNSALRKFKHVTAIRGALMLIPHILGAETFANRNFRERGVYIYFTRGHQPLREGNRRKELSTWFLEIYNKTRRISISEMFRENKLSRMKHC